MRLRHYLVLVASALCCSYSYCEVITGTTNNAASAAQQWVMTNVLPQQAGLTVGSVVYRYTAVKNTADPLKVSVQNENALGSGLIFRSTDDWTGLPGNTINKVVPVDNIPIQYWGNGSIVTDGIGSVTNPNVVYTYKYDTCFDPMTDPRCPGYAEARYKWLLENGFFNQTTSVENPLDNQFVKESMDKTVDKKDEDDEKEDISGKSEGEKSDKKKSEKREAIAKAAINNALATANTVSQNTLIQAMNNVPDFKMYYTSMPGGYYADTIKLDTKRLPENKRALRMGLAQQVLHDRMVESQYNKNDKGEQ